MRTKKLKSNEPSLRDKLSQNFLRDFEADFAAHGVDVIKLLREKHPDRYAELAARLIAATEPKGDGIETAESQAEIGFNLLKAIGLSEFDITEAMVKEAVASNERFLEQLRAIKARAEGQMQ